VTLIVGLRCNEGAVLAADDLVVRRASPGRNNQVVHRTRATKLLQARGIAWGWAGYEDAQQRFSIEMFNEQVTASTHSRPNIQDGLEAGLRSALTKISDSDAVELRVLAAWWSARAGKTLMLSLNGMKPTVRSTFVDDRTNVEMIGSPFARQLAEHSLRTLGFGDFRDVGIEEAKTVATKVIADVSAGTDDVGRPAQIFEITASGVTEFDHTDVAALASSAATWTTELRATLVRETPPSESETTDVGISPPPARRRR
jgi:hypothetical protein